MITKEEILAEVDRRHLGCCLHALSPRPHQHECTDVLGTDPCCCLWVDDMHYTCEGRHLADIGGWLFIQGAEWAEEKRGNVYDS